MSKTTKHTPGPWSVEEQTRLGRENGIYVVAYEPEMPATPWLIARATRSAGFGEDPIDANARLMAASPELLQALQLLLAEVEKSGNATARDFGWPTVVSLARAAIAKATGEGSHAPAPD